MIEKIKQWLSHIYYKIVPNREVDFSKVVDVLGHPKDEKSFIYSFRDEDGYLFSRNIFVKPNTIIPMEKVFQIVDNGKIIGSCGTLTLIYSEIYKEYYLIDNMYLDGEPEQISESQAKILIEQWEQMKN